MKRALVIGLLGAESTGKSTLAAALAERIAADTGLVCTFVDEHLRTWCERSGRTPRADEQRAIAQTQHDRIAAAAAAHDVVVADTTALMVAVYSRLVFDDRSLDAWAGAAHSQLVDLTLVTALDLPWVPDGLQREGPHVRAPVDAMVRSPHAPRPGAACSRDWPSARPRKAAGSGSAPSATTRIANTACAPCARALDLPQLRHANGGFWHQE
jgi:nicotinamide riboside kinase